MKQTYKTITNERLILTDLNGVNTGNRLSYTSFNAVGEILLPNNISSHNKEVLRIYDYGYDVIDARHLPLSASRFSNLQAIRFNMYKIQWINEDVSEQDLYNWAKGKVAFYSIGKEDVIDITDSDIWRLVSETLGFVMSEQDMTSKSYSYWVSPWSNEAINKALKRYGEDNIAFFDVLVKERGMFARQCWNKTRQKKSEDTFLDAVRYVYEKYGYYSNELVAEQMGVSENYTLKLCKKYRDMLSDIPVTTMKSINAQNRVLKSGEAVHHEDREIITKARVERKSVEIGEPVSRPTVLKHWNTVEPHFIMLNELLYKEYSDKKK